MQEADSVLSTPPTNTSATLDERSHKAAEKVRRQILSRLQLASVEVRS